MQWRRVPVHLLPAVELPAISAEPIAPGEPILPSRLGTPAAGPAGWWAIEVPVPPGIVPGTDVRLVATDLTGGAPSIVPGVVVTVTGSGGAFDERVRALVAVPADGLGAVSTAAAEQRLSVAVAASQLPARIPAIDSEASNVAP